MLYKQISLQREWKPVYLSLPHGIMLYFKELKTSMMPVWRYTLPDWFQGNLHAGMHYSVSFYRQRTWIWFHCMELLKHCHGTAAVTAEWYFKVWI